MAGFYALDLSEDFMEELRETLADMIGPVRIDVFIGPNCNTCKDTYDLIKAIADSSPVRNGKRLVEMRVFDKSRQGDLEEFKRQGIERIPSVTLLDGYIRYTGIPAGEEIRGLIETIMRISEGDSGLEDETKEALAELSGRAYIETIVTPSCPYCPYAVLLANMFAYEAYKQGTKAVISDTVEAYENPDIADKYGVMSVPSIAINGRLVFIGVPYEEDFLNYVKAAIEGRLEEVAPIDMGDATGI
ncbi:MAG: thioredoxin family protein [Desulfurococcales archaeon]|nr:thioredoxin family protein [Desulfurococcales archaeon]MEB3779034.1 thioredoxin family protein [Desulfurococcales archaeon]